MVFSKHSVEVKSLDIFSEFREAKAEDKIKTIKKKQRAILLKVTKNILELDKWAI